MVNPQNCGLTTQLTLSSRAQLWKIFDKPVGFADYRVILTRKTSDKPTVRATNTMGMHNLNDMKAAESRSKTYENHSVAVLESQIGDYGADDVERLAIAIAIQKKRDKILDIANDQYKVALAVGMKTLNWTKVAAVAAIVAVVVTVIGMFYSSNKSNSTTVQPSQQIKEQPSKTKSESRGPVEDSNTSKPIKQP